MPSNTEPARNVELLEKVMQHITDHPEAHDQANWVDDCGTAACFAGWAAILAHGPKVLLEGGGFLIPGEWWATPMSVQAAKLLGLEAREGRVLFDACNNHDMLRLMVKDLVNGDVLQDSQHYRFEADQ